MRFDIVFPRASELANGIGDHSRALADTLADLGNDVRILCHGPQKDFSRSDMIAVWEGGELRDCSALRNALSQEPPDAVVIQWEQFSYGRRGYNPEISRLFEWLERVHPQVVRLLYAHETYPLPTSLGRAIMWSYQRRQIRRLAGHADWVLHSTGSGSRRLGRYRTSSVVLPVFSNIPVADHQVLSRSQVAGSEDNLLVAVFGGLDLFRSSYIESAFAAIARAQPGAKLIYVGKDGHLARRLVERAEDIRVFDYADAQTVSDVLRCADIALSPFADGVTSRRGSFAALLRHGVPTVTNFSAATEDSLRAAALGPAFLATEGSEPDFAVAAVRLAGDKQLQTNVRSALGDFVPTMPTPASTAKAIQTACEIRRSRDRQTASRKRVDTDT